MIAFPFDSHVGGYDENGYPIYDRATTSEEFALFFNCLLRDGVYGKGMCTVLAGSGMTATVGVGGMMIRGRFGYIVQEETVTFDAATSNPRYDTVVLRRDLSSSVNNIVVAVVKGTANKSPQVPALTRDGTIWELGIANVYIPANASAVSQANITDTRLDSERCGLVAAILTDIDTTALYAQIQSDLAQFKDVEQANFEAWFESLQTNLDGDVAATLTGDVAILKQDVSRVETKLDSKLEGSTRTVTLSTSGWSSSAPYTQTVSVTGVTANTSGWAAPADASFEEYGSCKVRISAQGSGTVTFKASKKPSNALTVDMILLEGVTA